jgi:hypothetical protein
MTMVHRASLLPRGRLPRLLPWLSPGLLPGLVLVVLALTGCASTEPYLRDGSWQPNNANDANLHAMVAVPADLATATPAGPADGGLAAAALDRLRQGRVTPLADTGLAPITPVASGTPTPAAAAPASGNSN